MDINDTRFNVACPKELSTSHRLQFQVPGIEFKISNLINGGHERTGSSQMTQLIKKDNVWKAFCWVK